MARRIRRELDVHQRSMTEEHPQIYSWCGTVYQLREGQQLLPDDKVNGMLLKKVVARKRAAEGWERKPFVGTVVGAIYERYFRHIVYLVNRHEDGEIIEVVKLSEVME